MTKQKIMGTESLALQVGMSRLGRVQEPASNNDPVVEILPLTGIGHALAYRVPGAMREDLHLGSLVQMPLVNRTVLGVVSSLGTTQEVPPEKMRYIQGIVYPWPVLTEDLLRLAEWMSAYYAASMESVFEIMIPAPVRKGMKPKTQRFLSPARTLDEAEWETLTRRAPKQAKLLRFLQEQVKPVPRALVLKRLDISPAVADALVEKGILHDEAEREERTVYEDEIAEAEALPQQDFDLNEEQQAAVDDLEKSLTADAFCTHLLHGVTGSGKTEVYLRAMRTCLEAGGSVLFLVPEVALTPQTVGRIRSRMEASGIKTVVWHSHLSAGERYDAWHALVNNEARVVVGARSAVFAPLRNLRLVIVDEEHEPAYKQEETPRYHGRNVAVYRAMLNGAVCVLGSATPSLETLYNAQRGQYKLSRLTRRVDKSQLPFIHVVDMKPEQMKQKGDALLSQLLVDKLLDRFEKKEQTILFLNRRGFFKRCVCPDCGHVVLCPHCSISMTFHRNQQRLRCHLCAHEKSPPLRCPECGSKKIHWMGFGTQKVEDVVQKVLPAARIMRIDADTMQKKNLFRKVLGDFRRGKIDLLVGTQMIAKGLDFPNVTLVGLVDADQSLHIPDFRAAERTFQLLVQVAGRAGRGDRPGDVIVQTFTPSSAPIQFARQGDFDGFLEEELEHRREFGYPPYRSVIRHLFRGRNPEKTAFVAESWAKFLGSQMPPGLEIRGPTPCPLEKARDHYRFHLWYFTGNVSRTITKLVALREKFHSVNDVQDIFDVDPMDVT